MMKTGLVIALGLGVAVADVSAARVKGITTMAELAAYAAKSGNTIKMKPGVYQMRDLMTDEMIARLKKEAVARKTGKSSRVSMLTFSGHKNRFDLRDVTIEVDTQLLSAFGRCDIQEFLITGNGNAIAGLTVTDIGNHPTARGGRSLTIEGDNNTLTNVTLNVRGSAPYGYGDLLGKGKRSVTPLQKHSGLLICGTNTKLFGCRVISRALGHCFFIQGGINTYFEDCYAEGEMRATDDMLAETEGVAFENGFRSVYGAQKVILPGYMKSLQECGFRTYGSGGPDKRKTGKVTLVNCTAKNVRVGFALAANEDTDPVELTGCAGIGCERAYFLEKAVVKECKGDAKYGPLIYLEGEEASRVDLTLLPETSDRIVHAVATICGTGHEVSIKGRRNAEHPILLGYGSPPAGEISAPIPLRAADEVKLVNETTMPVVVSGMAENCTVMTGSPVQNDGDEVEIVALTKAAQK